MGMNYGIANRLGAMSDQHARELLEMAFQSGITSFDTAPAYGNAENRIGAWLARTSLPVSDAAFIITKLSKIAKGADGTQLDELISSGLSQSLARLKIARIPMVLAHNATDLLSPQTLDVLKQHQTRGHIHRIGASVYDLDITGQLLDKGAITAIQIPYSIADRRFSESGLLAKARDLGITIFCRSAFLQGALLLPPARLPDYLADLRKPIATLNAIASKLNTPTAELLMRAVAFDPEIDSVVVGVESTTQLDELIQAINHGPPDPAAVSELVAAFDGLPANILNPGKWPKNRWR